MQEPDESDEEALGAVFPGDERQDVMVLSHFADEAGADLFLATPEETRG